MKIIVGLGNPGPKYETTRHNVGFLAIDFLADEWHADTPDKTFDAEVSEARVGGEKVFLVKPMKYMNNSGQTVGPLVKFYKCAPEDVIVIHDDLDLKPLSLRVKTGGGTGGHNGLKSIDAHLGAGLTGYHRVRLGIGKPSPLGPPIEVADYVLQLFSDEELKGLDELFKKTRSACELIMKDEMREAQNIYNGSN